MGRYFLNKFSFIVLTLYYRTDIFGGFGQPLITKYHTEREEAREVEALKNNPKISVLI